MLETLTAFQFAKHIAWPAWPSQLCESLHHLFCSELSQLTEAYALIQGSRDTFGQEAVDTLIKEMEDKRAHFIVRALDSKL